MYNTEISYLKKKKKNNVLHLFLKYRPTRRRFFLMFSVQVRGAMQITCFLIKYLY